MAYSVQNSKGDTYYLHSKTVTLRGDRQQVIYYFAKKEDAEFSVDEKPEDREVMENKRTKLPMLRKIKK